MAFQLSSAFSSHPTPLVAADACNITLSGLLPTVYSRSDAVRALLAYRPADRALLCRSERCRCAIAPGTVRRHLQRQHRVNAALSREAERYVSTLPRLQSPQELTPRPHGAPLDSDLASHAVFQCLHCCVVLGSRKQIKQHGNQQHGMLRAADATLYRRVTAQSWSAGAHRRYWVVTSIAAADLRPSTALAPVAPLDLNELMAQTAQQPLSERCSANS